MDLTSHPSAGGKVAANQDLTAPSDPLEARSLPAEGRQGTAPGILGTFQLLEGEAPPLILF